jgi:hypothetical protein
MTDTERLTGGFVSSIGESLFRIVPVPWGVDPAGPWVCLGNMRRVAPIKRRFSL